MVDHTQAFFSSYIELNKDALRNNLEYLRHRFGPDTVYSSVIKGNAYGHGIEHILPLAEECGVRHFSVFSAEEALQACNARTENSEIMIMGMIDDQVLDWAVEFDISFYVFETGRIEAAIEAAQKVGKPARIHIELETGMFRTGFTEDELDDVIRLVSENREQLEVEGVCMHFAGAESISNYLRVKNQMKEFARLLRIIKKKGLAYKKCHTACSAAAIRYPRTVMDMVRIGIAQYGLWPNRETYMHDVVERNGDEFADDPLKRVISWKSRVMSIKTVPANRFIGYGTNYLTNSKTTVAAVPVGYVHGFNRSLSNLGRILVRGRRASVIGLVNMNMLLVDISNIPDVKRGDDVIIIGKYGENELSVGSFSELTNKLNYETLARLPQDIPRYVV